MSSPRLPTNLKDLSAAVNAGYVDWGTLANLNMKKVTTAKKPAAPPSKPVFGAGK